MTRRKPVVRDPQDVRMRKDLARIAHKAVAIAQAAQKIADGHEEAYEAGLSNGRRGDVIGGRGTAFDDTDPTHSTAASWDHRRIRGAVRFTRGAVGRAERELDRAMDRLTDCWLDIDPDLKRDRMERRARAREATDGSS